MERGERWGLRSATERGLRTALCALFRDGLKIPRSLRTEDRRVLEQIIFAHYCADPRIRTVLFVGCDWYTAHYQRSYFAAHDYWTLDPDATRRRFGARQHVVAPLQELCRYFPGDFFDLIVCNGVYGWGLNRVADCERALSQCHTCLAQEGHLLFGWNDVPLRDPAPLSEVRGLSAFSEYVFPGLETSRYLTNTSNSHTYGFYRKSLRGLGT